MITLPQPWQSLAPQGFPGMLSAGIAYCNEREHCFKPRLSFLSTVSAVAVLEPMLCDWTSRIGLVLLLLFGVIVLAQRWFVNQLYQAFHTDFPWDSLQSVHWLLWAVAVLLLNYCLSLNWEEFCICWSDIDKLCELSSAARMLEIYSNIIRYVHEVSSKTWTLI